MAEERQEDLVIQEQEDGTVIIGGSSPPPQEASEETQEATDTPDGQGDHEDEEAAAGETAEEAEARRQRNRQRKQLNKQRRQEHVETLRREIAQRDSLLEEMAQRLAVVERKASGSEMARIDVAMKEANDAYNYFKTQVGQAVESANGALHAEALEKMQQAQARLQQLNGIKRAMLAPVQNPPPRALDPRLVQHAQNWMSQNPWYDPSGADPDSAVTMALDDSLAREGWNPSTPEFWQELDARVKRYLPHRAKVAHNRPSPGGQARVPVAGGSGAPDTGRPAGSYTLSPARVQAMKDAGIWDDPKERADMISRYQEQDRQAARR